jgi:amidohydrolase
MTPNIRPEIMKLKDSIIATRRDIHKHPELAFEEVRTAKIVAERLESLGISIQENVGKTGVVGVLECNGNGPTIALRADMDALPIQETGDLPFKSVHDGKMHACGHDAHVATLLGVAEVLSKMKSTLNGRLKFIFQPAEEGEGGAKYMIDDGALDGADAIIGAHMWNYQEVGTIGVKSGPVMAAADGFDIQIKGVGGHGAAPQGTVDAIVVASHLIQSFQTIVSRNTNPLESTVVTVGTIHGGSNFNVISDSVHLEGTTRAYSEENRQLIKTRLHDIVDGTAKMFGADITLQYWDGYPPTINDANVTKRVFEASQNIVGKGATEPYLSMGGEDFSYFAQKVPGCFFFIGSSPKGKPLMSVPHHCSHFNIDEEAMLIGASVFVNMVESWLN